MFISKKIIPFLFVGVFSVNASEVQDFLFYPKYPALVPIDGSLTIDDRGESTVGLNINPFKQAYTLSSYCQIYKKYVPIWGITRWWLLAPKGVLRDASGLRYEVTSANWDVVYSGAAQAPGYEAYVSPALPTLWDEPGSDHSCWELGTEQGAAGIHHRWIARVRVERATAAPGRYTLNIPARIAYEEVKGGGVGDSIGRERYPILLSQRPPVNISLHLTVTSKCSFSNSQIDLSHGRISTAVAEGHKTRPYNLNVRCEPGTSVTMKLIGNNPVSGKTSNYTKCGEWGSCELTFNGGKYNETMTMSGSTSLAITSTFHRNPGRPVEGPFVGSGVLSILVN